MIENHDFYGAENEGNGEIDRFDYDNNLCDYRGVPYQGLTVSPLKKLYYSLREAAHKLGWSIDNLLHYGATGQVDFVFCPPPNVDIVVHRRDIDTEIDANQIFRFGKINTALLLLDGPSICAIEMDYDAFFTETYTVYEICVGEVKVTEFNSFFGDGEYDEYHFRVSLSKPAVIKRDNLRIMATEIQRIIQGSAKKATAKLQPQDRAAQLFAEYNYEKSIKTNGAAKVVAERHGISVQRLHQLIAPHKNNNPNNSKKTPNPFDHLFNGTQNKKSSP